MGHSRRRILTALAAAAVALPLGGCTDSDPEDDPDGQTSPAPKVNVLAGTSWAAGFAKGAGAATVATIAPATLQFQPSYQPTPADLAKVATADFVVYAETDGFAEQLKQAAAGTKAKLLPVKLENTPATVRAEVSRLAAQFGTAAAATTWLDAFEELYTAFTVGIKDIASIPPPKVVSEASLLHWAELGGLPVLATYGPGDATPEQIAAMTRAEPKFLLVDAHRPNPPSVPGAAQVDIVSYPGPDLDLRQVIQFNGERLTKVHVS